MDEMYFTITGCNHYFGNGFMKKGMKVKLEKEPDNVYDKEAIQVKVKGQGEDWLCGQQSLYRKRRVHECRQTL